MNKEDLDKILNSAGPVIQSAFEADMTAKTLLKHYVKTIAELTGKNKDEINSELDTIYQEVKKEKMKKIEKNNEDEKN